MAIQMFDKNGNSKIVDNPEVQTMLKSGWSFSRPAIKTCAKCGNTTCTCEMEIKTKTTRPKAMMRITKAQAEVIKPTKENDNGN